MLYFYKKILLIVKGNLRLLYKQNLVNLICLVDLTHILNFLLARFGFVFQLRSVIF